MLDLPILFEDLPGIIEVQTNALKNAGPDEYGRRCEDLCRVHRAAAAGDLFINYDPDGYVARLSDSARTRKFLLENTAETAKNLSRYCKISRTNGLFDAIAAGAHDLARDIVELSPKQRIEAFEYSDDYAYARIIHALAADESDAALAQLLGRYEDELGDRDSPRLPVCAAIIDRDSDSFLPAFASLAERRGEELIELEQSPSRDEMEFVSARHLFVEGLALLRLAGWRGLQCDREYLGCPSEARPLASS